MWTVVASCMLAGSPAYGQIPERWSLAVGGVWNTSNHLAFSEAMGAGAELSASLHTFALGTIGIDLGGATIGFELVCVTNLAPCDARALPRVGYASLSGERKLGAGVAPVLRFSVGEWIGRPVDIDGVAHGTEIGWTGMAEFGLQLGRVAPAVSYRMLGDTPQGRVDLASLLLRVEF